MKTLVVILTVIGSVYAQAQTLYVANDYDQVPVTGTLTEYDANSGASGNVITFPGGLFGIAAFGNDVFAGVSDGVAEYDATTGALVNGNFINGIAVASLAISGDNLFVGTPASRFAQYSAVTGALFTGDFMNVGYGTPEIAFSSSSIFASTVISSAVGLYSITGTLLNTNFITLSSPGGAGSLAVLGDKLFLENGSEYNATTGMLINPNFDVGGQLAVSGNNLFVLNGQSVIEYDVITGTVIGDHLLGITPGYLQYLTVASIPEPSTWLMLSVGFVGVILVRQRLTRFQQSHHFFHRKSF